MKIGVMLRTLDEDQGIGIYTRNVVPRLLRFDPQDEYFLFYRSEVGRGSFAGFPNAREIVLDLPTKPLWDQVGVPWMARKYDLDLVFNTKFTVPLLTGRHTVMTLHGSDWFVYPEHYQRLDIAYIRVFMPRYCRKADHLISNSELTTNDFVRILGVPREKITTIPLAANECFHPVTEEERLQEVRRRYGLPNRFILSVTKHFRGKNVPRIIEAFGQIPRGIRGSLVLVGHGVDRYLDELGLRGTPLAADIITPGWISQEDLAALYTLASAFAFPSRYESFGMPVLEAMACGCPVVASDDGSMPALTSGAAALIDPDRPEELAEALRRVLEDEELAGTMRAAGLERATHYSWDDHARRTVEVFRSCVSHAGHLPSPLHRGGLA